MYYAAAWWVCYIDRMKKPNAQNRTSNATEAEIVHLLQGADSDPRSFDALIATWNTIFEANRQLGSHTLADVEGAAITALSNSDAVVSHSVVGRQVGQMLERFDHPAFLVNEESKILAQNTAASEQFMLNAKDSITKLPYDLVADEPISKMVYACLNPRKNQHDTVLRKAYSSESDGSATLSVTPSRLNEDGTGEALVFVIDVRWKTDATLLIKREFDLTETERELLAQFLAGNSTQDIAKERMRSHATVRTQFHCLMTKMGAGNQTELLRIALSVSQFVEDIDEIANVLRHPFRKRFDLVRNAGRCVEVTMAGDFSGAPVIFLPSCVGYTFPPLAEQAFHNAGICVLSVCRPGYGDTDPVLPNEGYLQTCALDIQALLDQLGHQTCILLSMNTSAAIMYDITAFFADKVSHLVQVSGSVPSCYLEGCQTSSSWTQGAARAAQKHPALKDFMIKAGIKAWRALGQRKFMSSQFRKDSFELEAVLKPAYLKEYQNALDAATKQGLQAAVQDVQTAFTNYRNSVIDCDTPTLVIHGDRDGIFPIEAVRKFTTDFPQSHTLLEVKKAGFPLLFTHASLVAEKISALHK